MASAHVLERQGTAWHVVVHTPVPSGNNSAGVPWKTAFLNSGRSGTTALPDGTGPGQVTAAEKAAILAGDTLEFHLNVEVDTGTSPAATLNELIPRYMADIIVQWRRDLQYFGVTRA